MATKRTSTLEVKSKLKEHTGFVGSAKMLADLTGLSVKTIYNNTALRQELNIVLKGTEEDVKRHQAIITEYTQKLEDNYKVMCNAIHNHFFILFPFSEDEAPLEEVLKFKYSEKDTHTYKTVLKNLLLSNDIDLKERRGILSTLDLLNIPEVSVLPAQRELIKKVFREKTGFTPLEEQIIAVNAIISFSRNPDLSSGRIESIAGTSKSTCAAVAKTILERKYGFSKIPFLSLSAYTASNNMDGKTIAKDLKDVLGSKADINDLETIIECLEAALRLGLYAKRKLVFIDEFSTLSKEYLRIIDLLYTKKLFLGDTAQVRRDTSFVGPCIAVLKEQVRFKNSETTLQKTISLYRIRRQESKLVELLKKSAKDVFKSTLRFDLEGYSAKLHSSYEGSFNHILSREDIPFHSLDHVIVSFANRAVDEVNFVLNGRTTELRPGSIVRTIRTNGAIPSGTRGRLICYHEDLKKWDIELLNGSSILIPTSDLELAFALTTTRAQGGTWKYVTALLGTSDINSFFADSYSSTSRPSISLNIFLKTEVDRDKIKLLRALEDYKEGSRNTLLNTNVFNMVQEALKAGSTEKDVTKVLKSISRTVSQSLTEEEKEVYEKDSIKHISPKVSKTKTQDEVVLKNNDKSYGYVIVSPRGGYLYPKSSQKNKSLDEAVYTMEMELKNRPGYTGFITQNIKGQELVVFDFDHEHGVTRFKHLLDLTSGCVNDEGTSMHLKFATDKVIPTMHFKGKHGIGADILGNKTETNVNYKPNKKYNALNPAPLTEELFTEFMGYMHSL